MRFVTARRDHSLKAAFLPLSLLLVGCYPNEQTRFDIWATYASVQARYPDGSPPPDQLEVSETQRLRARYRLSDRDMTAIASEALEKGWPDSHHCDPGSEPVSMHVLLVDPRPATEIHGETAETCRLAIKAVPSVVVVVRADGTVSDATIYSSAHPVLDAQALVAVRSTHWLPGRLCGRAVDAKLLVNVPFNFWPCGDVDAAAR